MTIQSFARDAQLLLERQTGCSVKRTHVLEMLAAFFGHGTWAAMRSQYLPCDAGLGTAPDPKPGLLLARAIQLGYAQTVAQAIATALSEFASERCMHQIAWDDLFDLMARRIDTDDHGDHDHEDEVDPSDYEWAGTGREPSDPCASTILLSGLAAAASGGSARAHYLLACLYRCPQPNSYLYDQSLEGRRLNASERAWVEQYHVDVQRFERYQHHLHAAAQLGVRSAAVELVDEFTTPQAIELLRRCATVVDAPEILRISPTNEARWNRFKDAATRGDQRALEALATEGDRQSIERLAASGDRRTLYELAQEAIERQDAPAAWTWHNLALLNGIDLRSSTMRAYHSEGEHAGEFYDSDFGGPMYADGDEGIELPLVDRATQRASAQAAAARYKVAHGEQ